MQKNIFPILYFLNRGFYKPKRNNFKHDFAKGETLYLNGEEYGKVVDLNSDSLILRKENGEVRMIPINSKFYKNLSAFPF